MQLRPTSAPASSVPAAQPPHAASAAAADAVRPAARPAASRRKRAAPTGGFGVAAQGADANASTAVIELDLSGLEPVSTHLPSTHTSVCKFVRERFGNHASEVLDIMLLKT
eukprot:624339-Pleurochrysis_carterae.AAC.1